MTGFWLVIVVAGMVAQERPLSPLESMTQAVAAMSEASLNQAQASRRVHAAMDARRRAIDVLKTHPDRPRWMVDQAVDLFFRAINFRGAASLAVTVPSITSELGCSCRIRNSEVVPVRASREAS